MTDFQTPAASFGPVAEPYVLKLTVAVTAARP